MSELDIKVSQMEGNVPVTVLHISGDIDANSAQSLDAKATDILSAGGNQHIILDLTNNNYMSSAGFRSIHKIHTALQERNDESSCVKLLKPSDQIKRLMKTMGFDTHISSYDDLSQAVDAF